MDEDGLVVSLRENIIALVESATDAVILDLVYKLLSRRVH